MSNLPARRRLDQEAGAVTPTALATVLPMPANDSTPASGESVPESIDWEDLGRQLLVTSLDLRENDLSMQIAEFRSKVADGEQITKRDVSNLRDKVSMFLYLLQDLEDAHQAYDDELLEEFRKG